MRFNIIIIALSLVADGAYAESPRPIVQKAEFNGCRFSIIDSYGGSLEVSQYSPPKLAFYSFPSKPSAKNSLETSVTFYCDSSKGKKAFSDMGLEHNNGGWLLIQNKNDPDNLLNPKLYILDGNGLEGAASTYDQTTGEENRRVQGIGFCLTDQKQTLCGTSEAVGYVAYPKQSNLPKVIELLKTIKLLDPSSP